MYGQENRVIKKITAQPFLEPGLQQVYGNIEMINNDSGTMSIWQRPLVGDLRNNQRLYFVFEPKDIVMMQDPSTQPMRLMLKPGDLVRVVYVVKNNQKYAQSITVYSPQVTQTTITTTTTTSR